MRLSSCRPVAFEVELLMDRAKRPISADGERGQSLAAKAGLVLPRDSCRATMVAVEQSAELRRADDIVHLGLRPFLDGQRLGWRGIIQPLMGTVAVIPADELAHDQVGVTSADDHELIKALPPKSLNHSFDERVLIRRVDGRPEYGDLGRLQQLNKARGEFGIVVTD